MEDRNETNLKTFNTAKKFSDEILFPLMFEFKKSQRQSNYGHENLSLALEVPEEIRDIQRFNGLKAMNDTCADLLNAISSTVRLKNNKVEVKQLDEIINTVEQLRVIFHEQKNRFFTNTVRNMHQVETINRDYFEIVREIINTCYINTEILMTRNKLLFADSGDDYMSDEEIKEQIMKEYVDG
jgi:hypothetical protein